MHVLGWLIAVAWLLRVLEWRFHLRHIPDLTRPAYAMPTGPLPRLSVMVPARNEAANIAATLESLLAAEGVDLEVIAVDDRSGDQTGAIMDTFADRAVILHVTELPAGWLGKTHAMEMAARRATGEWLLFTDGDVLFDPRVLALSLRHALAVQADHLVLLPSLILKTACEGAMLAAMNSLTQWTIRLWKVSDPRARDFVGVGGFNLVRRAVYERLGGFEALRMEVMDDMRLGWMIKRAGFAQRVAAGPGLIRIRWLQGAFGVVGLAEKNAFAVYRFRLGLALLACFGVAVLVALPLAAPAAGGWASVAGVATYLSIGLAYFANRRVTQVSFWLAVFFAPAAAIVLFAFLRSIFLTLVRNGVVWRGTHYPLPELRRHAGRGW